jgi:PAS domain S-box-containing protein
VNRVQVLVDDEGNRNALSTLLESRFAVESGADLVDADLYLVDDRTFPAYRDRLFERKRESHPTFCPVVLIRRQDTRVNVELTDPGAELDQEFQLVDDAISAPVERRVLFQRMENLLTRRDQSIELTRRYERTEARFRALFQTIPDPGFVVDDERQITETNDAFCDLCSADREALVGSDPVDLAVFEECDDQTLRSALADSGVETADPDARDDLIVVSEGGEQQFLEVRHQTRYVEGEPHTVVVMHDVTELKATNEQLEDFASIVTHDLRNPMNVAMARIDIVRQKLSNREGIDDDLDLLQGSLERMNDLIEGVHTLVRETAVEETERLELESAARAAWRNVETADGELRCVGADVEVRAERRRLLQLFENLFRNAHEHADEVVTVEVGRVDGEGFYVADDGPGIPDEHGEEVFEAGVTTASDGSGLGLRIVAEIAGSHDWNVAVTESEAGGARFEITGAALCRQSDEGDSHSSVS